MSTSESNYGGPWGLLNLFKDDWLVTRQAAKLFFASAIYLLALTPVFLCSTDMAHWPSSMKLAWNVAGGIGAIAVFFLWIGMLRYLIRIDQSNKWIRRLSLVILVLGFWYGACLYCFALYIPQVLRRERQQT